MVNTNHIKTIKEWDETGGCGLWSLIQFWLETRLAVLRMLGHSSFPWGCGRWGAWSRLFTPSWCCFCHLSPVSLSPVESSPKPHCWIPFSRFFSQGWPVIAPLFSEARLSSSIWNEADLLIQGQIRQTPQGRSQRASDGVPSLSLGLLPVTCGNESWCAAG